MIASGAYSHSAVFLLLVTYDEDIGQLACGVGTYFIGYFVVVEVCDGSKALILQRLRHVLGIFGLCIGDIEHHNLLGSEPCGQCASVLFNQNTDETLQAANDGAVQHQGAVAVAVFAYKFGIKALWQVGVYLNGAALPLAAQCVFKCVFDFWAVEGAFAWQDGEFAA